MTKKNNPETESPTLKAPAAKAPAKTAAPKRHRKATPAVDAPATESIAAPAPEVHLDTREVARLAYSYYASRGYQPGSPVEDWFRAERELRQHRLANPN